VGIELQRSIPFPRISVGRLINYLKFVVEMGSVSVGELKERRLDFGKGRGDITRFLERLGIIVVNDNNVTCADPCLRLVVLYASIGNPVVHAMLMKRVFQYKLMVKIAEEMGEGSLEDLYNRLSEEVEKISPSTWVNNVAFKTLIGFAKDVGAIDVKNGVFKYLGDPLRNSIVSCLSDRSAVVRGVNVAARGELDSCLGYKTECCREIPSPGRNYCVIDLDCVVEEIYQQI